MIKNTIFGTADIFLIQEMQCVIIKHLRRLVAILKETLDTPKQILLIDIIPISAIISQRDAVQKDRTVDIITECLCSLNALGLIIKEIFLEERDTINKEKTEEVLAPLM